MMTSVTFSPQLQLLNIKRDKPGRHDIYLAVINALPMFMNLEKYQRVRHKTRMLLWPTA